MGSFSNLEKKCCSVYFAGVYAMVQWNCNTKFQAFHKDAGIFFVWRNRLTDSRLGNDNHWFGCSPKVMSKFFKGQVHG